MIYDYIIIGAGPAGAVCARQLALNNKKCIILDKEISKDEKVCGGAVPFKCIELLRSVGIDLKLLIKRGAVPVSSFWIYKNGVKTEYPYNDGEHAIGLRRKILDDFLIEQARQAGAEVAWGCNIRQIRQKDDLFYTLDYIGRKIIIAAGARGFYSKEYADIYKKQTFGISAQINGKSILDTDKFYFWYPQGDDEYFWCFPVGEDIWNIGVWSKNSPVHMMKKYQQGLERYILPVFSEFQYLRRPRAAFLGNVNLQSTVKVDCSVVGDFGGFNNYRTGEGIFNAILSAIDTADKLIRESTRTV